MFSNCMSKCDCVRVCVCFTQEKDGGQKSNFAATVACKKCINNKKKPEKKVFLIDKSFKRFPSMHYPNYILLKFCIRFTLSFQFHLCVSFEFVSSVCVCVLRLALDFGAFIFHTLYFVRFRFWSHICMCQPILFLSLYSAFSYRCSAFFSFHFV